MTCKGVSLNGRVVTVKSIDNNTKKVSTYALNKDKAQKNLKNKKEHIGEINIILYF